MKTYKFLFVISALFLFNQGLVANPIKVFETEDFSPSAEDHWKRKLVTTLPEDFKERVYSTNQEHYKGKVEFES